MATEDLMSRVLSNLDEIDGPLSGAGWAGKCRGRVVGIMLAG